MLDLKKWLAVKDHRVEMVKSYIEGKTVTEISVEFNRPVTCVPCRSKRSNQQPGPPSSTTE